MSDEKRTSDPGSVDLAALTRNTPVRPRRAMPAEFIAALKDAGARPSLVAALERDRAEKLAIGD
jgi:hypothetical protein